jgi:hypothetical protein
MKSESAQLLAQELRVRIDCVARAMAGGGAREIYTRWHASRAALEAALEIVGTKEMQHGEFRIVDGDGCVWWSRHWDDQ